MLHFDPAVLNEINQLLAALFLAGGAALWKWMDNRSPLKNTQAEDIIRTAYMDLLDNAAKFGVSQAQSEETQVGDIDVGHPSVAAAANFVINHGPDLAARMGFDIRTLEGRAAIVRSVTLRVGQLMSPPDANGTVQAAIAPLTLPKSLVMSPPISRLLVAASDPALSPKPPPLSADLAKTG